VEAGESRSWGRTEGSRDRVVAVPPAGARGVTIDRARRVRGRDERGFFPYFDTRDGRSSEGCGIAAGRTMDPRWNVAPKQCPLFSLFICGRLEQLQETLYILSKC
jgi:hypothetical protein